ncbi:MAG: TrbG/VirB9 family P-type conjugative transfer protein, partial [Bacteroidota bacterium]
MINARLATLMMVLALPAQQVLADGLQTDLPSDQRMVVLPYDESDIYTINTRVGYQTSLVLGRDEEVETISVGDRSLWQIIPSGQRLFIRPMVENLSTNMTIVTNRRSYHFDLKSLAEDSEESPVYVARFHYPDAAAPSNSRSHTTLETASAPAGFSPEYQTLPHTPTVNYNYTYTGEDSAAPQQVFDDVQNTF